MASRRHRLAIIATLATVVATATPSAGGVLNASWTMPTTNADGTPLTNLASFKVYYGTANAPCPGSTFVSVPAPTSTPGSNQIATATLTRLTTGVTYFASVTAVNSSGGESACSPVGSAAARSEFSVTPGGTVNFGSVNIGTTADQTFTVQNTSGAIVSGTVSTSAPFSVVSGGSFTLTANGSTATVTVRFTPTVGAVANGNVTFTANGESVSRTVTGTGVVGTNPVPTLSALSPTSATAGGPAVTLTVSGSNFVSGSTVRWNGSARTTTFVSATQLTAAITAADVAAAANIPVTIFTPAPGGGTSGALSFSVNNPTPVLSGLAPTAATAGSGPITLVVSGSGFTSGSTVRWNGSPRTTTFATPSQLTATITAADLSAAGSAQVSVATPAPGGGTSGVLPFAINSAAAAAPSPVPAPAPDTTPPVISALTVFSVSASTATITFVTNEPSDTQLEYGTTTAYGTLSTLQSGLGTKHAETLNGLAPGTTYYVRARSRDQAGNLAISDGVTFKTADAPVTGQPRIRKHWKRWFENLWSYWRS